LKCKYIGNGGLTSEGHPVVDSDITRSREFGDFTEDVMDTMGLIPLSHCCYVSWKIINSAIDVSGDWSMTLTTISYQPIASEITNLFGDQRSS
jgi:hypothetical protein